MDKKDCINAIDLFAGAGGFSLGMENAGINVIAAVEFDKQIAETYKHNHEHTKMYVDDICNLDAAELKDDFTKQGVQCDLIFGGPPCQGFSMAGNRIRTKCAFLEDKRNYLFKEYIRFVDFFKPKVFVIENVPGILNYADGAVKNEIFETFESMGYRLAAKVLCAKNFGVPQMRNRAVIIGNNVGIEPEYFFPKETHNEGNYVTIRDAISDLPPLEAGTGAEKEYYTQNAGLTDYQLRMRTSKGYVTNHISSQHKPETLEILKMVKQGQTMKDLPEKYRTKSVHSGAYGRMIYDEPAYTLTTRLNTPSVGRITHPEQNRTITPREAARIQSFPDDYEFLGDITSVGKQIGNAVPPLMAQAIGEQIMNLI